MNLTACGYCDSLFCQCPTDDGPQDAPTWDALFEAREFAADSYWRGYQQALTDALDVVDKGGRAEQQIRGLMEEQR